MGIVIISILVTQLLQFSFSVDQYLSLSCDRVVVSLMEVEEVFHRISPHRRKVIFFESKLSA